MGVRERVIVWKDTLRNALLPVVTVLGVQTGFLLGGSVVVETVFGIPGLGRLLVESFNTRDYPVTIGVMMFVAAVFVAINMVVDLLYGVINPAHPLRVRSWEGVTMAAESSAETPQPGGTGRKHASVHHTGEPSLLRRLASRPGSLFSLIGVGFFLLLALVGPLLAPHDPAGLVGDSLADPAASTGWEPTASAATCSAASCTARRSPSSSASAAVACALALGTLLGMLAGMWAGSRVDSLIMRLLDVVLAFPLLVLVPVVTGILGRRDSGSGRWRSATRCWWRSRSVWCWCRSSPASPAPACSPRCARTTSSRSSPSAAVPATFCCATCCPTSRPRWWCRRRSRWRWRSPSRRRSPSSASAYGHRRRAGAHLLAEASKQLTLGGWWLVVFPVHGDRAGRAGLQPPR